jgi:fungalysin/thermolysin propeptide
MTRNILLIAFLGVALATALMFPFANSNASRAIPDKSIGSPQSARTGPLPDYDIRLAGKGEFTDYDLSSASARSAGLNVAAQARAAAVARFQSRLNSGAAQKLHAKANETGAIKNLFIEGATLSEPRSDTADNIARGFLGGNPALFALRGADASNLRLINEDNDRGTTFLAYAQTVGGLKVFEGSVQVVVNRNGEVLSVREGFLVDGQTADLNPAVD